MSRTENLFNLCKKVDQGQGQGQDKEPTQTKLSLFQPTNRPLRPVIYDAQTQSFQLGIFQSRWYGHWPQSQRNLN